MSIQIDFKLFWVFFPFFHVSKNTACLNWKGFLVTLHGFNSATGKKPGPHGCSQITRRYRARSRVERCVARESLGIQKPARGTTTSRGGAGRGLEFATRFSDGALIGAQTVDIKWLFGFWMRMMMMMMMMMIIILWWFQVFTLWNDRYTITIAILKKLVVWSPKFFFFWWEWIHALGEVAGIQWWLIFLGEIYRITHHIQ